MQHILKYLPLALFISSIFVASPSFAQTTQAPQAGQSQKFLNCINNAGTDHKTVLNCVEQETKEQKLRLLDTYQKIIAGIPEAEKAKFKNLHTQLVDYVNKNCNTILNTSSSNSSATASNKCDTAEVQKKSSELEAMLKQYIK
ncbi:MAG: hypothetical protein RLZZ210_797 [Pseudomonadota bacterium]|jgi:uncharacterized protein YecT (DUF1311 family)